jgi:biopolymer transport protein TolR
MAEINVTPLVDVMLVLLIIFMVTAPMMQQGVNVDVPVAPGQPLESKREAETIVITIKPDDQIMINNDPVAEDQLLDKIVAAKKATPNLEVNLRGDKKASYGTVLRIMAALTNAGIKDVGMITAPQEQSTPKK